MLQEKYFRFEDIKKLSDNKKLIFFDLGANIGSISKKIIDLGLRDYELHLFEPNKKIISDFKSKFGNFNNVFINNSLVDIENNKKTFLIGNKKNATNSMLLEISDEWNSDKKKFNKIINVDAIDIQEYINKVFLSNYYKNWFSIIKMDIEGSEWNVLERFINKNTFRLINVLLIEFHGPDKVEKSKSIISDITACINKNKNFKKTKIYKECSPGKYELFKI